jgi:hypothetical protein
MQKKLTLTIAQDVYEGLHKTIGRRKISKYIEDIVRPHVIQPDLDADYTEMAKDEKGERAAIEWAETTYRDAFDETR